MPIATVADLRRHLRLAVEVELSTLNAYLYVTLAAMFGGSEHQGGLVDRLYRLMTQLLAPTARYLLTLPAGSGRVAGPTFEPYPLGPDPRADLAALAEDVAVDHAPLGHVAELLAAHR